MEPIITLSDRSSFDFTRPEAMRYDIVVIAHSLSKLCRFTGHVSGNAIYSVAQHSVLVSRMVPPEHALDGLLHDAHEAYVGDMSAPLKLLCPDYCRVERAVEVACRRSFGLADTKAECVAEADTSIFIREYRAYLTSRDEEFSALDGEGFVTKVGAWSPAAAKALFLERFEELTGAARIEVTTVNDLAPVWITPPIL